MPSTAEIAEERAGAASDLEEDGAAAVLRYDRASPIVGAIDLPPADYVSATVWALIVEDSRRQEGAQGEIVPSRVRAIIADAHLGPLRGLAGLSEGAAPGPTGYELWLDSSISAEDIPVPGSATAVLYRVLGLSQTIRYGNAAVLHYLDIVGA